MNKNNDDNDRIHRIIKSEEETKANVDPATPSRKTDLPPRVTPALDKDNMPLPRRVDEIDLEGTRVTPAAYEPTTSRRLAATRVSQPPPPPSLSFLDKVQTWLASIEWRGNMGCFLRGLIVSAFALVLVTLCSGSYLLLQYYSVA